MGPAPFGARPRAPGSEYGSAENGNDQRTIVTRVLSTRPSATIFAM